MLNKDWESIIKEVRVKKKKEIEDIFEEENIVKRRKNKVFREYVEKKEKWYGGILVDKKKLKKEKLGIKKRIDNEGYWKGEYKGFVKKKVVRE